MRRVAPVGGTLAASDRRENVPRVAKREAVAVAPAVADKRLAWRVRAKPGPRSCEGVACADASVRELDA